MRLDANGSGNAIAHIDDTSIFARTDEYPRGFGRKSLEMNARRLVGAVLRPHHRKHRQLEVVRVAGQDLADVFVFRVGQSECTVNRVIHRPHASAPEHRVSAGLDVTVVVLAAV